MYVFAIESSIVHRLLMWQVRYFHKKKNSSAHCCIDLLLMEEFCCVFYGGSVGQDIHTNFFAVRIALKMKKWSINISKVRNFLEIDSSLHQPLCSNSFQKWKKKFLNGIILWIFRALCCAWMFTLCPGYFFGLKSTASTI